MSTKIEWTHRVNPDGTLVNGDTWNPLIGCDKVSAGCKNCYAIKTAWIRQHNSKMAEKYAGTVEKTASGALNWTGKVNMHEPSLQKPLKQKTPTTYFVNSMSDLFHEDVPFTFIKQVYDVMAQCKIHIFQILTKRPERMIEFHKWLFENVFPKEMDYLPVLSNVWLGVSVEDQKTADERIPLLLQVPAAVRFLSCEPLLGPVDLTQVASLFAPKGPEIKYTLDALTEGTIYDYEDDGFMDYTDGPWHSSIAWVIVGGESGPGARPMHPDWVRSIRDQCENAGTAFFFKQWGEFLPYKGPNKQRYFERASDNESFHGLSLNLMKQNGDPGHFDGGIWMDCLDSLMYCANHYAAKCEFLRVGKTAAGCLLDGKEHKKFPV